MHDYRNRLKLMASDKPREWFKISAKATDDGQPTVARVDLMDEIGMWGTTASDFVSQLNDIDTDEIDLHINSPGGEVWDAIAIYNALQDHDAQVNVTVDGLAASAASVIAMAGDQILMNKFSELMIHDAWGLCVGNAADMQDTASMLDRTSSNIAGIYAAQAGGSVDDWRAAMADETWYSADEAVAAGLATKVAGKGGKTAKARFDLTVFNHAGRANAPAPELVTPDAKTRDTVSDSSKEKQENRRMQPEHLEAIGLAEDATDDEVTTRLAELVEKSETAKPAEPKEGETPKTGDEPKEGENPAEVKPEGEKELTNAKFELPEGAAIIDKVQLERLQASAAKVDKMEADAVIKERDDYIVAAMDKGKFAPAERKEYEDIYDSNPRAARALIDKMVENKIPVKAVGRGDEANQVDEAAYPSGWASNLKVKEVRA